MKTRNKRLALLVAVPLFAGTFAAGLGMLNTIEARADEEPASYSITFGSIPTAVKNASGGYAENSGFLYTAMATDGFFQKDTEGHGLVQFDTLADNSLKLTGYDALHIRNWKWEFAANTSVVFAFEAKVDGTLEFDYTAATLADSPLKSTMDWNSIHSVYVEHEDGTIDTLVNYYHNADSVGGAYTGWSDLTGLLNRTVEVEKGDVVYYEVGSGAARNVENMQAATITLTEAAKEEEPPVEPAPETTVYSVSIGDIPYRTWYYNYETIENDGFDYRAMAGYFNASEDDYGLVPFDTKVDDNAVSCSTKDGLEFRNWKWFVGANNSVVLVITAKVDGTLAFDYSETTLKTTLDWNARHTVNVKRASGELETLVNYYHNADSVGGTYTGWSNPNELLTRTIEVKAGDVVYYEVGCDAARNLESVTAGKITLTEAVKGDEPELPVEPEIKEMEGAVATVGDIPAAINESKFGTLRYEGFDLRAMAASALFNANAEGYGLVPFDTYEETTSYKLLTNSGISGLYMYNWKWEVAANTSIVLELTATKDGAIAFDFTMLEKFSGFWDGWNTIFTVRRVNAADGSVDLLRNYFQNVDKTGNGVALNTTTDTYTIYHLMTEVMSLEVEVKAGDVVYYEIGATAGRNLQSVTVGTISYSEKTVDPEPEPEPEPQPEPGEIIEYVNFGSVPTNVYKAGYGYVDAVNVRYTAMAGLFDASAENYGLVPFDSYEESADNKTLTAASKSGLLLQNWRWYFGANTSGVLVIESKIKGTISFDYPTNQDGWNEPYNTIYTVHVLRAGGTLETLVNYFHGTDSVSGNTYTSATNNMADLRAALSIKIEVEVGDVIYYEVGSIQNGRNFQCREAAQFIAAPADEVLEARAEYASKLQAFYNTLTATDYSEENWTTINALYNSFASEAADLETVDEIAALYEAKIAAIMNTVKAEFKAKGEALVATLSESDYTAENWTSIQTLLSAYLANVESAEGVEAIKALHTEFVDAVYEVPATDFVAIKKAELRAQLQAIIDSLDEATFSEANWAAVREAFVDFQSGLADCTTEEAVKALYDAQYAVIVGVVSAQRGADLKAYYDGLDAANYSEEKFAALTAVYNTFATDAQECATIEEVEALYADVLEGMKQYKAEKQSVRFLDIPSGMVANDFGWIDGDVFSTKLYAGNVKTGNIVEIDSMGDTADDVFPSSLNPGWDGTGSMSGHVIARNWKWYITRDAGIIAAFKANTDLKLTITDIRLALDSTKTNGWTANTTLNVYIVRDGVAKLIKTVDSPASDEDFSGEFYLKEGNILYWEFISTSITEGSERNLEAVYATTVTADATAFDEQAYIDQNHDLDPAVTAKIEELLQALRDYYASLNEDDYSATNWLTLAQYVEQFEEACAGFDIETIEDVEKLYDEALNGMKSVMTKAQAAQDLLDTLQGYADELQAEYDKLLAENEYTEENKALLDAALEEGIAAVLAATNKSAGNTERLKALAALRAVEKGVPEQPKKKGCSGTVALAGGAVAVTVIAAAAVILTHKKKED